jgi:predicted nucleic acid-binding protein
VYLLDTNVVSLLDPRRREHAPDFLAWIRRNGRYLSLSVITLTELEAGILKLRREGKEKRAAEYQCLRHAIETDFADRVLVLDVAIALMMARIAEAARPAVVEIKDLIIAATASTHGLTVLTRNLRHFAPTGIPAIDPIAMLPPDVLG